VLGDVVCQYEWESSFVPEVKTVVFYGAALAEIVGVTCLIFGCGEGKTIWLFGDQRR